ncbi:hypothetical protein PMN64_11350 [Bradyrhizobium sp. UFLA01-814]|uniref:hypothetical protein n=1 Tax=Bradyrhizobium sp. UFLA01-814 TaxID=3023480 RepID=UPI00398B6153
MTLTSDPDPPRNDVARISHSYLARGPPRWPQPQAVSRGHIACLTAGITVEEMRGLSRLNLDLGKTLAVAETPLTDHDRSKPAPQAFELLEKCVISISVAGLSIGQE